MKLSNLSLSIGVPCTFPMVPLDFFSSFTMMEKPTFEYIPATNGPIHALRNEIVEKALHVGATKLMMCDVDQVYHPLTVTRLLSHKLPIVGALVHRRYRPFDSLMMKHVSIDERTDTYESIDEWEEGSLVEVDATGTGCIMWDTAVFKKMPYPWFKAQYNPDGSPIGEDFGFCMDLKAAGYKIYVDTSVPADHLATIRVNTALNRLYRAIENEKAAKMALNTRGCEADAD